MGVGQADGLDSEVLAGLARLTDPDVGDVDELLANPLLEGGITEVDRAAVLLLVLEHELPETGAIMLSIPWIKDVLFEAGLGEDEIQTSRSPVDHYSVYWFIKMSTRSPRSLRALLELQWMQDQLVETERWLTNSNTTIEGLIQTIATFVRHISVKSDSAMASILQMPFMQSLEPHDRNTFEVLWMTSDAGHSSTDGRTPLRQLLADPALAGGITNDSFGDVALADLRVRDLEASSALESLPWIEDGVSPSEGAGVLSLWKLANRDTAILQNVVSKQWVTDGLTDYESSALESYEQLVGQARYHKRVDNYSWHEEYALTIPDKPFMEGVGPTDAVLMRLATHLLQNGGLSSRADLLSTLFESEGTQTAERFITLPLAGEIALSVIWPSELDISRSQGPDVSVSRTMDVFEDAVRKTEKFMGQPFPQNQANILIYDYPTGELAYGGRTAFITIDPTISASEGTIFHETAHAYWTQSANWINEGSAELISFVLADRVLTFASPSCEDFNTIYEFIRALVIENQFQHFICNYALGGPLFMELHDSLGEDVFRERFANLYLRIWGLVITEGCVGIDEGVCYVKAAFVDGAAPEDAAVAEEIIDRRYFGTVADTS